MATFGAVSVEFLAGLPWHAYRAVMREASEASKEG
jgi:hypothetical protein